MSLVPHHIVIQYRDADLHDPKVLNEFVEAVQTATHDEIHPETLLLWTPNLPEKDKLIKIHDKLHTIARENAATIHRVGWRTIPILARRVYIRLDLTHKNGTRFHVILAWKRRDRAKGEPEKERALTTRCVWGFNPRAPGGWICELEADVWKEARSLFLKLLANNELPELPRGANRRCFTDPEPSDMPTPAA